MLDLVTKAFWVLRKRPLHFLGLVGQYWRFAKSRWSQKLFLGPSSGVIVGENVRIQAIGCLSAEKPHARIVLGEDSIVYEKAQVEAYGQGHIEIGKGCVLGEVRLYSRARVSLGDRVVTSWNVFIQDFDPHPLEPELRATQMRQITENFRPSYRAKREIPKLDWAFPTDPIEVGDDCWLGANCTLLKGVRLGKGCIVATGAVVTAGTYPDRSILAGVPAKIVKTLP